MVRRRRTSVHECGPQLWTEVGDSAPCEPRAAKVAAEEAAKVAAEGTPLGAALAHLATRIRRAQWTTTYTTG